MAEIKVICKKCGARMHNRKSAWKAAEFANLYYTCTNVECSRTAVFNLEHSHDVTPSGLDGHGLIKALLDRLKPDERQFALDLLQGQAG